ncbi:MAG: sugar O-acetyltransferase [Clostridia bacterium]|nr:sugar O-acetyltransferase [Clostridia bacterium]
MTEREKMVAGQLYNPTDPELMALRRKVRQACVDYNNSNEDEEQKRYDLLHSVLKSHKNEFYFEPTIRFDYGCNTSIGENFYANFNSVILDVAPVTIGDNVMFGPNVTIATPVHPLVADERIIQQYPDGVYDLEYAKPITICDGVWLASGVIVNGGVTIGKNSVIGSGSVVTRDIPEGVIAVGNPCRVLRKITDEDRMFNKKVVK